MTVLVGHPQSFGQSPDVVVSEAQGLDLGQFGVLGQSRQDASQRVQSRVQVVHAVALSVVRLRPAPAPLSAPPMPASASHARLRGRRVL